MHAAFPSTPHQTRSLQRLLHPGVAQLDAVLGLQLLVEVLHVQIEILLPVECEHLLHRRHRNPPMRRLAPSPVQQPVVPLFLIALPPPPHVPVTDPQDLRRLKPGNLLRHCLQHYILYFHRPLHRGPRISFHAPHGLPPSPPAKRTSHLLSHPDISCATDIDRPSRLRVRRGAAKVVRELEVVMKKSVPVESASASTASGFLDKKIKELGDWRGKTLAKVRDIIHKADPEIVEELKWVNATR